MIIPAPVSLALALLNEAGYEAYVVGGCVRDALLGKTPGDYDICTSATPAETEAVFAGYRLIETGLKHGTVTVILDTYALEITTFRTESGYSDGRHPDEVTFTRTLAEDLSRRDFTVNAMAYSPKSGLVDLYGGRDDLNAGIIRCVGDPTLRFTEDALRIVRALRFAAVLGFDVEPETDKAIRALANRLSLISCERITAELKKAIVGDHFPNILTSFPSVFGVFLPEIIPCIDYDQNNPHHDFDLLTHLAKTVSYLPKDPILRLSGLLHDIGKPCSQSLDENGISHFYGHSAKSALMADTALKRLKLSNAEILRIVTLIRHHDGVIEPTERAVKRKIAKLGAPLFYDLLSLQRADHCAQRANNDFRKEYDDEIFHIANNVMQANECLSSKQMAIDGNDIMKIGLMGPQIGKMLAILLDAVLDGTVENEKKALMAYAESNRKDVDS